MFATIAENMCLIAFPFADVMSGMQPPILRLPIRAEYIIRLVGHPLWCPGCERRSRRKHPVYNY